MSEPLDGADTPLLPSSSVVLDELKLLRRYEGISPERVQRYAPVLQTLPVVLDEREQRRFSAGDEHIAAYNAVGCAIENLVRDPRKKVILRHTLNYESNKFDLGSRRDAAAAELFASTKACEKIENQAYIDLAALLVDATATPCVTRRRIVTDQEVLEALNHFRNLRDLQAVSVYAREGGAAREASARHLLGRYPEIRSYVESHPSIDSTVDAAGTLDSLLRYTIDVWYARDWAERGGVWEGGRILPPEIAHLLFEPATQGAGPVFQDVARAAQAFEWPINPESSSAPPLWNSELEAPTVDFYHSRRQTLLLVYRRAMLLANQARSRGVSRRESGRIVGDGQ